MKAMRWFLINGAMGAAMWYGFVQGVEGARNVAQFMTWAMFVMSFGAFSDDVCKSVSKRGRSVPAWMTAIYDLALACAFAWFGYWWTAAAVMLSLALVESLYERGAALLKEAKPAAT